ncbi:MAG: DUF2190 family protein [Planctomycetes bacterium]|nr:DUF2190 family protein [Planctomycetota bacterium]
MAKTPEEVRAMLFPNATYPVAKRLAALDDIPYTPTANAPAGTIIILARRVLVANTPLLVGYKGSLTATGIFAFPKAVGTAIPKDTDVYWDATAGVVTADSGGGTRPKAGVTVANGKIDDDAVRLVLGE